MSFNYDKATYTQLAEAAEGGVLNPEIMQQISNANQDKELNLWTKADQGTHSNEECFWTIDAIVEGDSTDADVALNEGQDIDGNKSTIGQRVSNRTNISGGRIVVSYSADEADKVGRGAELGYQAAKYTTELEWKLQKRAYANLPSVIGDAGNSGAPTAPESAGLEAQMTGELFQPTNDQNVGGWTTTRSFTAESNLQSAASAGTPSAGGLDKYSSGVIPAWDYTGVTPGPLTETLLRNAVQGRWNIVGRKTTLMGMNRGVVNRLWSEYSFTSTSRIASEISDRSDGSRSPRTSEGASNVFVSDFGVIEFVPENQMEPSDGPGGSRDTLFLLDLDWIEISKRWGFRGERQGKTGINEKWQLSTSWQINCLDPQRQAGVFAIDASQPMTFA